MVVNNKKILVITLVSIIVILLGIIIYFFIIKPEVEKRRMSDIQQGVEYAVYQIMLEASKCQEVPLTYYNTTMGIVAVDCLNIVGENNEATN